MDVTLFPIVTPLKLNSLKALSSIATTSKMFPESESVT